MYAIDTNKANLIIAEFSLRSKLFRFVHDSIDKFESQKVNFHFVVFNRLANKLPT